MHEHNIDKKPLLIDEALSSQPIKNTFRLAWEFIILNQKFTFITMSFFIVSHLLGMISVLAFISMFLAGSFALAIQIYIGKIFYTTHSINSYIHEIEISTTETLWNRTISPAFGAYLGWLVFLLMFVFLFGILAGMSGLISENMTKGDFLNLFLSVGTPILLLLLLLSYVQPLVQSNIILSESFKEGFLAVFTIFSLELWKRSINKEYFQFVAIFGTIIMVILFIVIVLLESIALATGLFLFSNIILLGCLYIFIVMLAMGSMMARRMVED